MTQETGREAILYKIKMKNNNLELLLEDLLSEEQLWLITKMLMLGKKI